MCVVLVLTRVCIGRVSCRRLLNTFAEEQAAEDALYYLSEALQRGVIDIDVFLKVIAHCRASISVPNRDVQGDDTSL